MLEKEFNPAAIYNRVVHYYMDKKGYDKEAANSIAQTVVRKESQKRICRTPGCGHFSHDHLRNNGVCLIVNCTCISFTRHVVIGTGGGAGMQHAGVKNTTV